MPIAQDEAVIRIRGQVDPSLQASASAAGSAYQRLATDVRMASADFQAGIISVDDYKIALATARQEAIQLRGAGVVPVGRDLAAMNTVLRTTAATSDVARQGLGTIRSTLAGLTAHAIGARGAFGTLGGALLQFAAGNTIAVGVIAGIAGITLAWRKLTEQTREAREEAKKYREEGAKAFTSDVLGPIFGLEGRRAILERDRDRIRRELATAQAGEVFTDTRSGLTTRLPADQARVGQLTADLREANRALIANERELTEEREKAAEAAKEARDAWVEERMAKFGLMDSTSRAVRGGLRLTDPQYVTQNAIGAAAGDSLPIANRIIGEMRQREFELLETRRQLNVMLAQGTITQDEYAKALAGVEGATKRAAISTTQFAVAAINSAAALLATAAGGGLTVGGFLGFAGGLLSFVNPIAGAAVGGLGAIISATERSDDRAVPVRIADVSDRAASAMSRARTGPDRIQLLVVDSRGNIREIRDLLNRATQRDAVERIQGAA